MIEWTKCASRWNGVGPGLLADSGSSARCLAVAEPDHSQSQVEYATETLAQHGVELEADGYRLREVDESRIHATAHASPQPLLPPLDQVE